MQRFHTSFELDKNRPTRRFALSVLSLAAVFGFLSVGSSRVEATCGDYLAHGENLTQSGMTGHDPSDMQDSDPTGGVPHRRPCHGPSCQQGPLQNPLSTPVISVEPQDRWGWMADIVVPALDQVSFLAHLSEPVSLPMIAFRLDRPPKA